MFLPQESNAVVEYTLSSDTSEPKSTFRLGFLNAKQKAALAIQSKQLATDTKESSSWWFPIIAHSIRGWSNINTADGKPYEFKTQQSIINGFGEFTIMADECFEIFKLEDVFELASEVYRINYMDDSKKKDSLSPVTSSLTHSSSKSATKKKS